MRNAKKLPKPHPVTASQHPLNENMLLHSYVQRTYYVWTFLEVPCTQCTLYKDMYIFFRGVNSRYCGRFLNSATQLGTNAPICGEYKSL